MDFFLKTVRSQSQGKAFATGQLLLAALEQLSDVGGKALTTASDGLYDHVPI